MSAARQTKQGVEDYDAPRCEANRRNIASLDDPKVARGLRLRDDSAPGTAVAGFQNWSSCCRAAGGSARAKSTFSSIGAARASSAAKSTG